MVQYEMEEETYTRIGKILLGIAMIIVVIYVIDLLTGGKVSGGIARPICTMLVYWTPLGKIGAGYVCPHVPV